MNRRAFLVGAAVAPVAFWVTPEVFSVSVAHADIGSRPPSTPPRESRVAEQPMGDALPDDLPAQLPYTGEELSNEAKLAGLAVVAGLGVAALTKTPSQQWSDR